LQQSINAEVIREGLAMVPRKLKSWEKAAGETLTRLKKLEEEAKAGRLGMWE
jgi:staphylococcal nuclease domain-containing protein 1